MEDESKVENAGARTASPLSEESVVVATDLIGMGLSLAEVIANDQTVSEEDRKHYASLLENGRRVFENFSTMARYIIERHGKEAK